MRSDYANVGRWSWALSAMRTDRFRSAVLGALVLLGLIVRAQTAAAAVIDGGHFFPPSAVVQANQMIARMQAKTGKTILIQTFVSIPPSIEKQFPHQSLHEFFYRWAGVVGKTQHVQGVVIIICRKPGYLIVRADKATLGSAFTQSEQARASELMLDLFSGSQFKSGLLSGVDFITRTIERHAEQLQAAKGGGAGARANQPSVRSHRVMILIAVLVGIFFLFWLVTRRGKAMQPPMEGPTGGTNPQAAGLTPETTPTGAGPQTSGTGAMGSFVSGLAGGAVGAVAGNMLYNAIGGNPSGLNSPAQPGSTAPLNMGSAENDAADTTADNTSDWSNAGNDDASGGSFGGSDDDSAAEAGDDSSAGDDGSTDDVDDDGGSF